MVGVRTATGAGIERVVMLALWTGAALTCLLGAALDLPAGTHEGAGAQLVDLLRVAGTATLAVVLLLGPGLAWRAWSGRKASLGFLPLPGLGALVCTGGLAWLLAKPIGAHVASFVVLAPLLALLPLAVFRAGPEGLLEPGERRALLAIACMLGLAIGKALWSVGPDGELLAGSVSRTLEVGSRPDSRIPFHVVQLVANGTTPYSELGTSYFAPYNFSSRGPLSGLASAPIVLLAGGRPPTSMPDQPWTPFDPEGFMAFRLATMAFAATALMSLWSLVRRLAGEGAAQLSVLLAATTPFLVHEVWFTWPKVLASSFALLAALSLIGGRPFRAGLLVGIGYLAHPVALLSMPALGLIALWPIVGAHLRRPQVRSALMLVVGAGIFFVFWRIVNGDHYMQDGFFRYFNEAGAQMHAPVWSEPGTWLSHRLESLGNTLVPLLLPLAHGDHPSINVFGGTSPAVVHFFFQYWNTLPFGIAIVFFPLLLASLWRAGRLWPWPVFATVVVPFLAFTVYWGSYETGMLPEGLQTWVLTLVAVVAIQQGQAGFPWLRSTPVRVLLSLRAVEVVAMALVPPLATRTLLVSERFELVDTFALLAVVGFGVALIALVWRRYGVEGAEGATPRSPTATKATRAAIAARTARAE
jgi:hypothetical protein